VRKYGPRSAYKWKANEQQEYKRARDAAVNAFTELNMRSKLRRLARLELKGAGINAQQWGMEVLYRRSPRASG
jgi:hypothetical protein